MVGPGDTVTQCDDKGTSVQWLAIDQMDSSQQFVHDQHRRRLIWSLVQYTAYDMVFLGFQRISSSSYETIEHRHCFILVLYWYALTSMTRPSSVCFTGGQYTGFSVCKHASDVVAKMMVQATQQVAVLFEYALPSNCLTWQDSSDCCRAAEHSSKLLASGICIKYCAWLEHELQTSNLIPHESLHQQCSLLGAALAKQKYWPDRILSRRSLYASAFPARSCCHVLLSAPSDAKRAVACLLGPRFS